MKHQVISTVGATKLQLLKSIYVSKHIYTLKTSNKVIIFRGKNIIMKENAIRMLKSCKTMEAFSIWWRKKDHTA